MKILIVDDEELTREGVIASVDFAKLGIDEVFQADDGVNGLRLAREIRPDIILCDVRMPRLDGIAMLEQLEKEYPDTVVVFMSGYSDKEYLKAAIQLKAIDYIEKPIETTELNETIRKAVEKCSRIKLQAIANEEHESSTALELAYRFTIPYLSNQEAVDRLCRKISELHGIQVPFYVTTYLVKLRNVPEEPQIVSDIYEALKGYLGSMHMDVIYTEKKTYHLVFHVFCDIEPRRNTLMAIAQKLGEIISPLGEYNIAVGNTVYGKENVYKSYSQAVILLQRCFFGSLGAVEMAKDDEEEAFGYSGLDRIRELAGQFNSLIEAGNKEDCTAVLKALAKAAAEGSILENQIKAIYHDMLLHLYRIRRKQGIATDLSIENQETIMNTVENCFSFDKLHSILEERTKDFFSDTEEMVVDNPTIRLICEYISDHYQNADLSVKSISDFAALSTSYACTYFKAETGMTLNRYITDFRMKKAKQLLTDPRNRVSDISAAVGYSDGNYFAKSFRKFTGLSPSEYREQVIRS